MLFRLLGSVEVRFQDRTLDAGEPRLRAVLAALLVNAGQVVSGDTLVDRVWGEQPPRCARDTLRTYVTRVRRLLEQADAAGGSRPTVVRHPGGYLCDVDPDQVDLHRFRRLVGEARAAGPTEVRSLGLLRDALSLWRGEALTGVPGDWAVRTRDAWHREYLDAVVAWARAELHTGDPASLPGPLGDLSVRHPEVEPLTAALMRALVALGRPTDALAQGLRHRKQLAEEYGTDPGPELLGLYEAIVCGDVVCGDVAGDTAPTRPSPPAPGGAAPAPAGAAPAPGGAAPVPGEGVLAGASPGPRRARRGPVLAWVGSAAVALTVGGLALLDPPSSWTADVTRSSATSGGSGASDPGASAPGAVDVAASGEEFAETAGGRPTLWEPYEMERRNGSSWSPSMVRVEGGELQIAGVGRNHRGRGNVAGGACWCADGAPVRQYGVWQVRAKFDVGTGYGPVIGLWPAEDDSQGWITLARVDQGSRNSMYALVQGPDDTDVESSPVSGDLTSWHTYSVEWRRDFVAVRMDDRVVLDTRDLHETVTIPAGPMFLYVQLVPGPDGPVPAPDAATPSQVVLHVDWVRYHP